MPDRADWNIVDNAPPPYARCVISGFGDGPFVDFGTRIAAIDPNVAVNIDVLRDAARFVGMVDEAEHAEALALVETLGAQVENLQRQVDLFEQFKQSVDTIVSQDYVARKKPGRKVAA